MGGTIACAGRDRVRLLLWRGGVALSAGLAALNLLVGASGGLARLGLATPQAAIDVHGAASARRLVAGGSRIGWPVHPSRCYPRMVDTPVGGAVRCPLLGGPERSHGAPATFPRP